MIEPAVLLMEGYTVICYKLETSSVGWHPVTITDVYYATVKYF